MTSSFYLCLLPTCCSGPPLPFSEIDQCVIWGSERMHDCQNKVIQIESLIHYGIQVIVDDFFAITTDRHDIIR
jgi:hypothetical protein